MAERAAEPTAIAKDLHSCAHCGTLHESSAWEDGSRYCSDACTPSARLAQAESLLADCRLALEGTSIGDDWYTERDALLARIAKALR